MKKEQQNERPQVRPAGANVVDGYTALMMLGDTVLREWRWVGYWQEVK